jgi:hypothetical protein
MPRGAIAAFTSSGRGDRRVQRSTARREQGGLSEHTRWQHRERFDDLPVAVEYAYHWVTILNVVHADHDLDDAGPRLSDKLEPQQQPRRSAAADGRRPSEMLHRCYSSENQIVTLPIQR